MSARQSMRMLSLCSGIGGIDYAWNVVLGQEIAGQVEIDDYCNAVLAKHWPDVSRMRDIREVNGDEFGAIDLVAGGIPCQPWSVAGQQRGTRDDRHLWPAMRRIIQTARPTWVLIENVAGFAALALDDVCTDLEFLFYEVTAFMVPAAAVAAPHLRERVFVVAHANEQRRQQEPRSASRHEASASWRPIQERATLRHHVTASNGEGATGMAHANSKRRQEGIASKRSPARQSDWRAGADVADADGYGLEDRLTQRSTSKPKQHRRSTAAHQTVADDDSSRCDGLTLVEGQTQTRRGRTCQGGDGQAVAASTRPQGQERAKSPVRRDTLRQDARQAQPRLGGTVAGISRWLDGHRWPAGPTEAQHEWEAPRTITGSIPNRAHRLKALGNAVVPAQVAPILAAIIEAHWHYEEA